MKGFVEPLMERVEAASEQKLRVLCTAIQTPENPS